MAVVVAVIVVVLGILVSVALHELGHMVPAKLFGVRVSQYMVGFGPTLWSRRRGETEYGVKAIPLGGYVRLIGMYPPASGERALEEASGRRRGWAREITAAAREASLEEVRPGEEGRAFYRLSAPRKVVVMLGGPVMNLVIAFVLALVAFSGIGVLAGTTTVASVSACVPSGSADTCAGGAAPSPAAAAGLRPGDRVTAYGGTPVSGWEDLTAAIEAHGTAPTTVTVERDGRSVTLDVTPAERTRQVTGADGATSTVTAPFLGIGPTTTRQHLGPGEAVAFTGTVTWETAKLVVQLPVKVVDTLRATFGDGVRGADSVISPVGVGRVAADVAGADTVSVTARVQSMLLLLANLNVALFVFNLIPLVPLDGGHVAGAVYEGAKRQVARLRGLPRPGPADVARMAPLAYGMFVVLTLMGLLLVYADIVDPVRLG